jgi:hypothetical protein
LYDLKTAFLARLKRQREEAHQQLELFSSGTMTLYRNRVDITAENMDRIRQTIADYDRLISDVEQELNA